jgi:predicted ATPase
MNAEATKAITRLHVKGFRSLRDVSLEPGRVTVLIGANGSGKSNLLSFLRFVPALQARSLQRYVGQAGGAGTLLYRGSQVTRAITCELEFTHDDHAARYHAELELTATEQLIFRDEGVQTRRPAEPWNKPVSLGHGHAESRLDKAVPKAHRSAVRTVRGWLLHMSFFHFHDTSPTSPLRSNARAIDHRALLPDGRNLAAYLLALRQSDDAASRAAWALFHGLVRQVAPFVKELDPTPVNADPATFRFDDPQGALDTITVRLDWIDQQDVRFGVHQLSDGTLRAIALFAALTQPGNALPSFISIDEPELGLHPAALALLADLIRVVSSRSQILLATQSPGLLDFFEAAEVVVAERVDGATEVRRLDPKALAGWLEDYSLSELFDKNVLGGRP